MFFDGEEKQLNAITLSCRNVTLTPSSLSSHILSAPSSFTNQALKISFLFHLSQPKLWPPLLLWFTLILCIDHGLCHLFLLIILLKKQFHLGIPCIGMLTFFFRYLHTFFICHWYRL